jgi:hypothetical protein
MEANATAASKAPSHVYAIVPRDFIGPLATLGIACIIFAWIGPLSALDWIRPEISVHNPDQAGFLWKRSAAMAPGDATVLISGDSSCATGIDPMLVSEGPEGDRILNLGLVIDLPFSVYADALQIAVDASHGNAKVAVLLVSPQRLAHQVSGPYYESLWNGRELSGSEWKGGAQFLAEARTQWRASVPFRLLEPPLRGDGRLLYGFPSCITAYVDLHRGTFQDPGEFRRAQRREDSASLAPLPELVGEGNSFRQLWKGKVPLFVALAPIPESYAPGGYLLGRPKVLKAFAEAVGADGVLEDLPAVMADVFFASPTHLNRFGQAVYTPRFLASVKALLQRSDSKPGSG